MDPNHEESDKEDPVAAALAAAVAPPTPKPAKKKIVRTSLKISDLENIIWTAQGGEYLVQMIVDCADTAITNLETSSSKNYRRFFGVKCLYRFHFKLLARFIDKLEDKSI